MLQSMKYITRLASYKYRALRVDTDQGSNGAAHVRRGQTTFHAAPAAASAVAEAATVTAAAAAAAVAVAVPAADANKFHGLSSLSWCLFLHMEATTLIRAGKSNKRETEFWFGRTF